MVKENLTALKYLEIDFAFCRVAYDNLTCCKMALRCFKILLDIPNIFTFSDLYQLLWIAFNIAWIEILGWKYLALWMRNLKVNIAIFWISH